MITNRIGECGGLPSLEQGMADIAFDILDEGKITSHPLSNEHSPMSDPEKGKPHGR